MRILWIHQYFATLQGWGSARTFETAVRWAQAGHAVDILCTPAYDPSLAGRGEVAVAPGVRAFVSRVRYSPHMGFAARLAAFGGFTGFARRFVRRQGGNYDIAIASSAPLSVAIPALTGRRRWALPYVFETIDVWPDAAIAADVLRNPLLKALSFRLEAAAYRGASHVVTCSDGMTARVTGKGVPAEKVTTIPNGCDNVRFAPTPAARAAARRAFGVGDDRTVCLYTGAMGRSNAIEDVIAAVRATAADRRIAWRFAGDGPAAGALRALDDGTGRVGFLGMRSNADLPGLLAGGDAALVTFLHAPLFRENSPNKFFDAIAAGLPVVFNRSTWLEPWLDRYGNAFVCREAPAAPAIAEALRRLAGDPALRGRMGAASRRLACEVFDRDRLAARYLAILEAHAARA
jgi:glycosyltransferase involved in cell wall biosynthesis